MKDVLLTVLRDRNSSTARFRRASDHLAVLVCAEALAKLPHSPVTVTTPLAPAEGLKSAGSVMFVPIIRAGLALLPAFLSAVPDAPVALVGMQRDEVTAQPGLYYRKFPGGLPDSAIVLDPMLATGGSSLLVVDMLQEIGYAPRDIYHAGVLAAGEGLQRLAAAIPAANITVAAVDPGLDGRKFISPGLGDYGDRYFGT